MVMVFSDLTDQLIVNTRAHYTNHQIISCLMNLLENTITINEDVNEFF